MLSQVQIPHCPIQVTNPYSDLLLLYLIGNLKIKKILLSLSLVAYPLNSWSGGRQELSETGEFTLSISESLWLYHSWSDGERPLPPETGGMFDGL